MPKLTPLLQQYHRIKKEHQGTILFFRIGDFYETFYEDARICSEVLGIALTSRPHGKENRIPLAGVPHQAVEGYAIKLLRSGYKVALCDQVEDPRLAQGAKRIVKREVREVITPGTVTIPALLEEGRNNFLVGLAREGDRFGIARSDLSTGEFSVTEVEKGDLTEELYRIEPTEILLAASLLSDSPSLQEQLAQVNPNITVREEHHFTYDLAHERLLNHFQVASLSGFGCDGMRVGISAAGAVLAYLEETQNTRIEHIQKLIPYFPSDYLILDEMTRRNLELVEKCGEEKKGGGEGTLLGVLDETRTPMGKRLLRQWVLSPLLDLAKIQSRQDGVEELFLSTFLREDLRRILGKLSDLERTNGRIACGKGNGRDLIALKNSLKRLPQLTQIGQPESTILRSSIQKIGEFQPLVQLIEERIVEDPPLSITEGGTIREGFHPQLDELREMAFRGKDWIARLEEIERKRTGISSLKVGFNYIFGYYIEVTKPNLKRVPPNYIRKQTLVNGERYVTKELQDYEAKVLGAEERMKALEYEIFIETRDSIAKETPRIQETTRALAELDGLASLATVALTKGYVRPQVNDGDEIQVEDGCHPVVAESAQEGFVPNDAYLTNTTDQILLITGPNMSGKSTFLRQVGLLVIMAQMGGFVPAKKARIGLVDRIFTRVGASDDLSKGISTFLAEMIEIANILHNATSKSLLLLDEIGRGTATFDGLSIAWDISMPIPRLPQRPFLPLTSTN